MSGHGTLTTTTTNTSAIRKPPTPVSTFRQKFPHSQHPSTLPRIGSPTCQSSRQHKTHLKNDLPPIDSPIIQRIFRGGNRVYNQSTHPPSPSPKTSSSKSGKNLYPHDKLYAALCVGFAALLLAGEFTWDQWDRILLNLLDYVYSANMCHSTLKPDQSPSLYHNPKTDPFGKGTEIHLAPAGSQICPVAAFHHPPPTASLFIEPILWPLFKIVACLSNQKLTVSRRLQIFRIFLSTEGRSSLCKSGRHTPH